MSFLYVPVMAAKRGEFTALINLRSSASEKTIPLFELPSKTPGAKALEKAINRTAANAGKAWGARPAFLDISKWSPNTRTESGIHVLEYAFAQFRANSVFTHPVVGYDRWDDPAYCQALKNILKSYTVTPCIRLDNEAVQHDMHDFAYFSGRINDMMKSLDVGPDNCYVMVDFGDVTTDSVPDLIANTEMAVTILRNLGFITVIVVGGSMPIAVNEAVDTPDAEGCIPRIEMMAWKAIFSSSADRKIIFGDYLIRSAEAVEGVIAPHANAKIRYTIDNQFFIVRGHSKKLDSLTLQHKELAKKLAASPHYMGAQFSWGDSEAFSCSIGIKEIRDATLMIAVDSNHHINAVLDEIFSHQLQVVSSSMDSTESK